MDYGDILSYIEHIVEGIEFDELDMPEVHTKLQDLIVEIEDTIQSNEEFNFDDLV